MSARKMRKRKDNIVRVNYEDAVWQYMLDHARPHEEFGYRAACVFRNRDDFNRRIRARERGLYRHSIEEVNRMKVTPARLKGKGKLPPNLKERIKRRLMSFISKL